MCLNTFNNPSSQIVFKINLTLNIVLLSDRAHCSPYGGTIILFNFTGIISHLSAVPFPQHLCTHTGDTLLFRTIDCVWSFSPSPLLTAHTAAQMHPGLFSAFWLSACPLVHSAFMTDCFTTITHTVSIFEISAQQGKTLVNKISSAQYTLKCLFL